MQCPPPAGWLPLPWPLSLAMLPGCVMSSLIPNPDFCFGGPASRAAWRGTRALAHVSGKEDWGLRCTAAALLAGPETSCAMPAVRAVPYAVRAVACAVRAAQDEEVALSGEVLVVQQRVHEALCDNINTQVGGRRG